MMRRQNVVKRWVHKWCFRSNKYIAIFYCVSNAYSNTTLLQEIGDKLSLKKLILNEYCDLPFSTNFLLCETADPQSCLQLSCFMFTYLTYILSNINKNLNHCILVVDCELLWESNLVSFAYRWHPWSLDRYIGKWESVCRWIQFQLGANDELFDISSSYAWDPGKWRKRCFFGERCKSGEMVGGQLPLGLNAGRALSQNPSPVKQSQQKCLTDKS